MFDYDLFLNMYLEAFALEHTFITSIERLSEKKREKERETESDVCLILILISWLLLVRMLPPLFHRRCVLAQVYNRVQTITVWVWMMKIRRTQNKNEGKNNNNKSKEMAYVTQFNWIHFDYMFNVSQSWWPMLHRDWFFVYFFPFPLSSRAIHCCQWLVQYFFFVLLFVCLLLLINQLIRISHVSGLNKTDS